MKAIETKYKGYRFRSRLEARWAVFFDALGVKWEYEKEGYDLGEAGWYLPDFWLPDVNAWVEIKPNKDAYNDKASAKAKALAAITEAPVVVVCGLPYIERWECGYSGGDSGYIHSPDGFWDNYHTLAICSRCKKVGWVFSDYAARLCDCFEDKGSSDPSVMSMAYAAARSARFEHGESPKW